MKKRTSKSKKSGSETLLSQAEAMLSRLAKGGWDKVFAHHGLDITPANLFEELLRPLAKIDRTSRGFEDFSCRGVRAIEPGRPCESLLFHGLASPNVLSYRTASAEKEVDCFPTPAEIELIENLVYGITPASVDELRVAARNAPLAIVVYAKEYRPAINTVHRRHADMCYSRTGVARVGTTNAKYLEEARGYLPFDEGNGKNVRVLPCRYAAYIATLVAGEAETHGPMRFIEPQQEATSTAGQQTDKVAGVTNLPTSLASSNDPGDASRRFWVPIHKLFSGNECLSGYDLSVTLTAQHVNEKLRRAHLFFGKIGHDGGWHEPHLSKDPFVFTDKIADLSGNADDGEGLVVPFVHKSLVGLARYKGKELTYVVPNSEAAGSGTGTFVSTLYLPQAGNGARTGPEYLHARFAVNFEGKAEQDLNELENVRGIVSKGGYRAKHVVDFTGDGWVDVSCPQLAMEIPHRFPAFSLVAAPDFYPGVKQRDLMQWWEQSVPKSVKETIWPENPGAPEVLSDQRIAANVELDGPGFELKDDTMTAIVGHLGESGPSRCRILPPRNRRSSMLTDGAAGVFAPGWDVSFNQKVGDPVGDEDGPLVSFFATYGLGSPFPEDAKLCAALSSYWPAAAPDITRTFPPSSRYATATPLLDATIGQDGGKPWDGVAGPKILDKRRRIVEYSDLAYADYVKTSLENGFDLSTIGTMTPQEYLARTVVMARAYQVLGANSTEEKVKFTVLSFKNADFKNDAELKKALKKTTSELSSAHSYRFEIFEAKPAASEKGKPFNKVWIGYDEIKVMYVDGLTALFTDEDGQWQSRRFRD